MDRDRRTLTALTALTDPRKSGVSVGTRHPSRAVWGTTPARARSTVGEFGGGGGTRGVDLTGTTHLGSYVGNRLNARRPLV